MSGPYKVVLLQLKADLSALAPASSKVELGAMEADQVYALAEKLLKVDTSANPRAEPAILVHRGERGWRIVAYKGVIRMHESTSALDDYWTVDTSIGLSRLPPFKGADSLASGGSRAQHAGGHAGSSRTRMLRTALEVTGLIGAGLVLMGVGLWFGLPRKKLSTPPPDVMLLTNAEESQSVFTEVAGTYATGKKPGDSIVVISQDGRVSLGSIGKDGKPLAPRIAEQAKAGRRKQVAVVVTSFGVIALNPPDAVDVGTYRWRKSAQN
ncbi:MAG TPA: hypothetical protein VFJ90_07525 [Candidatus Didemnitutus sp.]|nr:hypothetical protein [Candidatus Didemnitutus sp.]